MNLFKILSILGALVLCIPVNAQDKPHAVLAQSGIASDRPDLDAAFGINVDVSDTKPKKFDRNTAVLADEGTGNAGNLVTDPELLKKLNSDEVQAAKPVKNAFDDVFDEAAAQRAEVIRDNLKRFAFFIALVALYLLVRWRAIKRWLCDRRQRARVEKSKILDAIKFACIHCKQSIEANPSLAGTEATCPTCKSGIIVPREEASESAGQFVNVASSGTSVANESNGFGFVGIGLIVVLIGAAYYGHLRDLSVVAVFAALCVFVWKKRNQITPKRIAAIYLGWVFLNLSLLLFSPASPLSGESPTRKTYLTRDARRAFYPFISSDAYEGTVSGIFFDRIEFYDSTEFFIYLLGPVFILGVARLWMDGKPDAT